MSVLFTIGLCTHSITHQRMRVGSRLRIRAQKESAQDYTRKLALWRMASASRDSDRTAEIPRLENVGFAVMRKQFGEEEFEIKRGVLTLEYFVDDEIGYSYDVNFDLSEVFFKSCGQQRDEVPCSGEGWREERNMSSEIVRDERKVINRGLELAERLLSYPRFIKE